MRENRWVERHKELLLYIAVGVSMTFFNWIAYSDLITWMPMFFANAFSWGLTTLVTFLMNKLFVFESRSFDKGIVAKEFISFVTARGVTGMLEIVLQPQLYALGMDGPLFGVEGLEAKVTVCVILSIVNYISTKRWVFKTRVKRVESVATIHGRM